MTLGNWNREPSHGNTHLGQGFAGKSAERHRRGDKGRRPREHGEDRKHCPAHHLLPLLLLVCEIAGRRAKSRLMNFFSPLGSTYTEVRGVASSYSTRRNLFFFLDMPMFKRYQCSYSPAPFVPHRDLLIQTNVLSPSLPRVLSLHVKTQAYFTRHEDDSSYTSPTTGTVRGWK